MPALSVSGISLTRSARASVDGVFNLTNIDRWFLVQIEELVRLEEKVAEVGINGLDADFLRTLEA